MGHGGPDFLWFYGFGLNTKVQNLSPPSLPLVGGFRRRRAALTLAIGCPLGCLKLPRKEAFDPMDGWGEPNSSVSTSPSWLSRKPGGLFFSTPSLIPWQAARNAD